MNLDETQAAQEASTENTEGNFPKGPTSASGRIKVAEKGYDAETGTFSIAFSDGTKNDVELSSLPVNIQQLLALHGLAQKLGDSYAGVKGDVAEAKKRFDAVLEQLKSGDWAKAREASEGGARVTELAEAIARFRSAPIEKATAVVAKATPEQIKAWKGNAQLKAIIAQIRAEKAAERAKTADGGEAAADDLAGLVIE